MEYCGHCRAIRPTRKSTRKRTVRQPDGTVKTLIVDSYHCTRCNHFVGSMEREATPAPTAPAPETAGAAENQPATAGVENEEVEAASTE